MINANDFKTGMTIEYDGGIYVIVDFQPVKPGKGAAFTRTKMRNLRTKKMLERTFRVEEKLEVAFIEEKKVQFLYAAGKTYHFMDQDTFEQSTMDAEVLKDVVGFLKENMDVSLISYKHELLEVKLPMFVELEITHTEDGIRGDTTGGSLKPATLETGANISVPLFINQGDKIKIDTRTGAYVERV
ncbi:MAG: elongation factor P [Candidatus Omnitrophica bacterium]|nr:elongation factor P [Candidatus Omnitrophota bacterium]